MSVVHLFGQNQRLLRGQEKGRIPNLFLAFFGGSHFLTPRGKFSTLREFGTRIYTAGSVGGQKSLSLGRQSVGGCLLVCTRIDYGICMDSLAFLCI